MPTPIMDARIKAKHDTTANWNMTHNFIPLNGEIIVYDDVHAAYIDQTDTQINIPAIKIGDGTTDVKDLPFITDYNYAQMSSHINNAVAHTTAAEKSYWSSKINCEDTITNGVLTLFR